MHWEHIMKYVTLSGSWRDENGWPLSLPCEEVRRIARTACEEAALSPQGSPLVATTEKRKIWRPARGSMQNMHERTQIASVGSEAEQPAQLTKTSLQYSRTSSTKVTSHGQRNAKD